jgi:hypothetical protein
VRKLLFATIVVCFSLSNLPAQSTSTIVPGRTVVDQVLHVDGIFFTCVDIVAATQTAIEVGRDGMMHPEAVEC